MVLRFSALLISLFLVVCANKDDKCFWVDKDEVHIKGDSSRDGPVYGKIKIQPGQKGEFKWRLIDKKVPVKWDLRFCDNRGCHWDLPNEMVLKRLSDTSGERDRELKLIVGPNGGPGKGFVLLELSKTDTTEKKDTLQYEITVK